MTGITFKDLREKFPCLNRQQAEQIMMAFSKNSERFGPVATAEALEALAVQIRQSEAWRQESRLKALQDQFQNAAGRWEAYGS